MRRERPHPGAQLSLFDTIEGMRHQVMATDTPRGASPALPGKPGYASPDTGPGHPTPSPPATGSPRYRDQSVEPATMPRAPLIIDQTLIGLDPHLAKDRG
jgi:hypothetical protein